MTQQLNPHNIPEWTVTGLSAALRRTVEEGFSYVRVRGEISGCKRAPSGHLYLNLKDEGAVLGAICWNGVASRFPFKPEDGLEVIATGKMTTYAGQSKYQLVIDHLEPSGVGALMALLEKRKLALAGEGLFDASRKKPLPFLPEVIGIITSPTGAVIKDMLHRIEERFPRHILLWPVLVQGEKAAGQIAQALDGFNKLGESGRYPRPDVIIVARGGGSIEDLWAFNEEIVVRAIASSSIPIISAVGHETDTTLADYAADMRAPTPTAAAEFAVPVRAELLLLVEDLTLRLKRTLRRNLEEKLRRLETVFRSLGSPTRLLLERQQRFDHADSRLRRALPLQIERKQQKLALVSSKLVSPLPKIEVLSDRLQQLYNRLNHAVGIRLERAAHILSTQARLLEGYHYTRILERGFALVRDSGAHPVTSAKGILPGSKLQIEFHDGKQQVLVPGVEKKEKTAPPKVNAIQASLFDL